MRFIHLPLVVIIFAGTSCIDEGLFNSGKVVTKSIDLPGYETIEAESTFEIEIVPDSVNKVYVTCGENLHPFMKISVRDNVLYLKHEIKNNWSRKYEKVKLVLHTQPFSRINVRKPVKIFNHKIYKAPSFTIVDFMKYCELDVNVDVDYCLIAMSSDNFGQYRVKGRASNTEIWGWAPAVCGPTVWCRRTAGCFSGELAICLLM